MKKSTLFILFFILYSSFYSQDKEGFYGAKQFASFESLVFSPLLYNYTNKSNKYSKNDKNLKHSNDLLNFGFRFTYGYLTKRNIAICMETGIDFSNIYLSNYINNANFKCDKLIISRLNIQSFSFMPKIEFSTSKSLLPLGFSHQVGLGVSFTKLIDKNYSLNTYDITGFDSSNEPIYTLNTTSTDQLKNNFYDFKNTSLFKTYTFLYALNMRTPLTKKMLFNYGFRYTLNYFLSESNGPNSLYSLQKNDIQNSVNNQKFHNVITLTIGLTYAF